MLSIPPLSGRFYFGTDLTRINLGVLCALKERLAQDAPLALSPLMGNGGPLFARPDAALFYPVRWLALTLPPDWAVAFEIVVHFAAAAAATAWLARTFGVRAFTAGAAGVCFALSGTAIDLLRHAHYLIAAAWLPLIWAGTRAYLGRRGGVGAVLSVFGGLAGCLLGAEPQAFGIGVGVVAIELMLRLRAPSRRWGVLAAACAAAFLVGLAQWAPTLAEMALTSRTGNLRPEEALAWSLGPALWLGVVLPGMPTEYVAGVTNLFALLSPGADAPWNKTPFLGALVVAAALVGFSLRRARSPAVLAAVTTVFALGDQLPVLPLLMKVVPFFGRFRAPAKYWLIASLAIVIAAAIAAEAVRRSPVARRRLAYAGGAFAVALLAAWGWVGFSAGTLDAQAAARAAPLGGAPLGTLSAVLRSSLLEAFAPVALGLVLLKVERLRAWVLGVAALGVMSALSHELLIGPGLADLPAPAALRADPPPVLCVDPRLALGSFPVPDDGDLDFHTMQHLRAHLLPETQACADVRSGIAYSPLETTAAFSLFAGIRAGRASAIRAFGCTHWLGRAPFAPDVPVGSEAFDPGIGTGARLFGLPEPLEPQFVARGATLSPTEADAIARVARSPDRPRLVQVVDDPLHRLAPSALPSGDQASAPHGTWMSATRVEVRVEGVGGAVVGLRTPFLVGWHARQGATELPVVRIAGHQLGARVEDVAAGPITFEYRIPHFMRGLIAALVGIALLGAALTDVFRHRRIPKLVR